MTESISITDEEAKKVNAFSSKGDKKWGTTSPEISNTEGGNITGYRAFVTIDGIKTNTIVFCGVGIDEKKKTEPNKIWMSIDYSTGAWRVENKK